MRPGFVARMGGTTTTTPPLTDPLTLSPHVLLNPDAFGLVDGDPVASATDTSGNARHFTQAGTGERPTMRGGASLLNGHLVVEHDGVDDVLVGASLAALTDAHAFVVVKLDADPAVALATSGLWVMSTSGDAPTTIFPYTDGVVYDGFGSTARRTVGNPTPALTSWRIYEVRSASGSWEAKLDGATLFSTATNTVGFPAVPSIGGNEGGGRLDGRWAYFGIFPALTPTDAGRLRTYLQTRFGL